MILRLYRHNGMHGMHGMCDIGGENEIYKIELFYTVMIHFRFFQKELELFFNVQYFNGEHVLVG